MPKAKHSSTAAQAAQADLDDLDDLPTEFDDVEIFRVGDWTSSNGYRHDWTSEDLDAIVDAYMNQDEEHPWVAPVVLGHPVDNSPAYGWVEKVYRVGDVLMARLVKLNKAFVKMLKDGAFKNRSIMVDENNLLWHIGFLGAVPPAVSGLAPIEFKAPKGGRVMTFQLDGTTTGIEVPAEPIVAAASAMTVEQAQAAQQARSVTYGIKILTDKGSLLKPPQWAHLTDDQFADPVNYRFPLATSELFKASMRVFNSWDSEYNEDERILIYSRLYAAMTQLGLNEKDYYFSRRLAGGQRVNGIYSTFAAGIMNPTLQAFVEWLKTTYNEETANQTSAKIAELETQMSADLSSWITEIFGEEVGTAATTKLGELMSAQGTPDTTATGEPAAGDATTAAAAQPTPPTLAPGTPAFAAMQNRVAELERERRAEKHGAFCDGLISQGRIVPAQKPLIMTQLENAFASDAAGVTKDSYESNKKLYSQLPVQIHMGEIATSGTAGKGNKKTKPFASKNVDPESLEAYEKVEAYAKANKVPYATAMKHLTAEGVI